MKTAHLFTCLQQAALIAVLRLQFAARDDLEEP